MKPSDELKKDIVFAATMRGRAMTFHSTWGLFSPRQIDDGSYRLVETVELQPNDVTLDLGCGYGAIGLPLARECPDGAVHLVDRDFLAVEYARRNAELAGLGNCHAYLSNAFSHVPEGLAFDNVVSNLPAKVGKELLWIILQDAHARLKPGGQLVVVTIAGLRQFIKRNFVNVFGNYRKVKQGKSYCVARAVKE